MYEMVKDKLITVQDGSFCDDDLEKEFNRLPKGERYIKVNGINPKNANSVVKIYYQSNANYCLKELVPLQVALEFMQEPVFNVLRTKEQLGYSVYANLINTGGILGVCITVQSPATKFTPDHIHDRIEAFVKWFVDEKINVITDEEFDKMISTLVKKVKTVDTNLGDEFSRNWNRIMSKDYMFDVLVEDAKMLSACKKEDVIESISATIKCDSGRRNI